MAITLGAEVALALHLDLALTYADLETAVTGAGFTDYTIMRQVNGDGSGDVQLFVRSDVDQNGMQHLLPAVETLQMLVTTLQALPSTDVPDNPTPDNPTPDNPTPDNGGGGTPDNGGGEDPDSGDVVTPEPESNQPDGQNA